MRCERVGRGADPPFQGALDATKFGGRYYVSLVHDLHNREQSSYIYTWNTRRLRRIVYTGWSQPNQGVHVMVLGPAADVPSRRWSPISLTGRQQDRCSSGGSARAHTRTHDWKSSCAEILRSSGCRRRGGRGRGEEEEEEERGKKGKEKERTEEIGNDCRRVSSKFRRAKTPTLRNRGYDTIANARERVDDDEDDADTTMQAATSSSGSSSRSSGSSSRPRGRADGRVAVSVRERGGERESVVEETPPRAAGIQWE